MNLPELAARLKRNVVVVDEVAGALESYILTVGFRLASWGAVWPTLLLTSRTLQQVAQMERSSALAASIALELVGQATVNQWIKEADWNRDKAQSESAGRARWLFGAMCVYFAADFAFVGVLELPRVFAGEWAQLVLLIFPLMQVISTLVMVERVAQTQREAAAALAKAERAAARAFRARAKKAAREAAPEPRQLALARAESLIRLDKRGFRREVAQMNGGLAPLADALREPGANRADVLNDWLTTHGFESIPPGTARGWVPLVLEAAAQHGTGQGVGHEERLA